MLLRVKKYFLFPPTKHENIFFVLISAACFSLAVGYY